MLANIAVKIPPILIAIWVCGSEVYLFLSFKLYDVTAVELTLAIYGNYHIGHLKFN